MGFDMSEKHILALDIGGSKLILGLVSTAGELLDFVQRAIPTGTQKDDLLGLIDNTYAQLAEKADISHVTACGVTVPGLADPKKGLWIHAAFSGIANLPIADILKEKFGVPVYIENDVNACAIAEMRFGGAKDVADFIWVTVSNGVGGAVVLNGELYSGSCGNAGEIGHVKVEFENPLPCGCGGTGCLESMAAGPGIAKRYLAAIGQEWDGIMRSKEVSVLVAQGDTIARQCFEQTGEYLGVALGNAVNLMNPLRVFVGGGVTMDYDLFAPQMCEAFERTIFKKANPDAAIEKSHLGYYAGLLGAAALAI